MSQTKWSLPQYEFMRRDYARAGLLAGLVARAAGAESSLALRAALAASGAEDAEGSTLSTVVPVVRDLFAMDPGPDRTSRTAGALDIVTRALDLIETEGTSWVDDQGNPEKGLLDKVGDAGSSLWDVLKKKYESASSLIVALVLGVLLVGVGVLFFLYGRA